MQSLLRMAIILSGSLLLFRYVRQGTWSLWMFLCPDGDVTVSFDWSDWYRSRVLVPRFQADSIFNNTCIRKDVLATICFGRQVCRFAKHQSNHSYSEGLWGRSIPTIPFQKEHRKLVCKVSYFLPECFISEFHWTLFAFRVRSLGQTNVTPILTERRPLTSNRREISIRCHPIRSDNLPLWWRVCQVVAATVGS